MATTIQQVEEIPATYPPLPEGLSAAAAALNSAAIWQRIESYVGFRWTERNVVWVVEGPGEWCPPLLPATMLHVEIWNDLQWDTAELDPTPLGGYRLPNPVWYRFEASVGGGDVPAGITEAYRRLAEYLAAEDSLPGGVTKGSTGLGEIRVETERAANWIARALINSGAADLLRPFRRFG